MSDFSSDRQLNPPFYLSWPVIIISFIFWPVGLVLLFARLGRDRHAGITTGGVLKVAGVIVLLICLVGGYAIFDNDMTNFGDLTDDGYASLAVMGAFAVLGIILWRYGRTLQYRGRMVREYLGLIVNRRFSNLDEIARIVGKSRTQTEREIDFLIEKGYLPGALVDRGAGQVVVPSVLRHMEAESRWKSYQEGESPVSWEDVPAGPQGPQGPQVVTCRSCGAQGMVFPGRPAVCEYCGSALKVSGGGQ